jgi:hypothetical protein
MEKKNNEELQSSNEDGTIIGESIGRKFDVSKAEDRKDLDKYLASLSKVAGRNAHENDTLKRQLTKVQSLSNAQDDAELVSIINSEDAAPETKLLAQRLLNQDRQSQSNEIESNRAAYYSEAVQFVKTNIQGLPFEDDEVIDALLRKHEDRIRQSEDPAAEVLKVFNKYAGKKAPKIEETPDDHIGFGSNATPAMTVKSSSSNGKKDLTPAIDENSVFAAMGFGNRK